MAKTFSLPCEIFTHSCFFFVLLTSFPLMIISIIIYLANIYQVPVMSKAFFWTPLMFKHNFCLQRRGAHIVLQYKMVKDKRHKNKLIIRRYFSGYDDHKTIYEWTICEVLFLLNKYCFIIQEKNLCARVKLQYHRKLAIYLFY